MRVCSTCQNEFDPGLEACPYCGTAVVSANVESGPSIVAPEESSAGKVEKPSAAKITPAAPKPAAKPKPVAAESSADAEKPVAPKSPAPKASDPKLVKAMKSSVPWPLVAALGAVMIFLVVTIIWNFYASGSFDEPSSQPKTIQSARAAAGAAGAVTAETAPTSTEATETTALAVQRPPEIEKWFSRMQTDPSGMAESVQKLSELGQRDEALAELRKLLHEERPDLRFGAKTALRSLGQRAGYDRCSNGVKPTYADDVIEFTACAAEISDAGVLSVSWQIHFGRDTVSSDQPASVTAMPGAYYLVSVSGPGLKKPVEQMFKARALENGSMNTKLAESLQPGDFNVTFFAHADFPRNGRPHVVERSVALTVDR